MKINDSCTTECPSWSSLLDNNNPWAIDLNNNPLGNRTLFFVNNPIGFGPNEKANNNPIDWNHPLGFAWACLRDDEIERFNKKMRIKFDNL